MVSKPDIEQSDVPSDNPYRRYLTLQGTEPEIYGIVTNFSVNMDACLFYDIGLYPTMSTNNPTGQLQANYTLGLVTPQPFSPNGNIDYSEGVQIPNPGAQVLQASNPPGLHNNIAQTGVIYLVINGMQFSPRTSMYLNGVFRNNTIPLQVTPQSNDELNLISFESPQSFDYPAQYISYLEYSVWDSSFNPIQNLTDFKLQIVLSDTSQLPLNSQNFLGTSST
jgi:hypothetical protein